MNLDGVVLNRDRGVFTRPIILDVYSSVVYTRHPIILAENQNRLYISRILRKELQSGSLGGSCARVIRESGNFHQDSGFDNLGIVCLCGGGVAGGKTKRL